MAEERDEALEAISAMAEANEAARDTTLPPEIRAVAENAATIAANKIADEYGPRRS
ncbi:hypothetical protein ACH41E_02720 [Streptomyces sp. NPDC020412]|uniref:hypothetical protein n=1 Tax=Streptomyces sp. NPDC020412 TaxID=3365073 RepID=UPI00378BD938